VRDVPVPERIVDVAKVGRLLSNMLSPFLSPSIVEAEAARAFLSSRRSVRCERLSLSSLESLAVSISRCRKDRTEKSRFSTNCHQAPGRAWRQRELAEEVRERAAEVRVNSVLSRQFHQFIQLVQTCISTWRNTAIVGTLTTISLLNRVPAVFALETAIQPDAALVCSLHIEMRELENSNSKTRTKADQSESKNATRYIR